MPEGIYIPNMSMEEDVGSPGPGLRGSHKLPAVGPGNQTLVLWKSSNCLRVTSSLQLLQWWLWHWPDSLQTVKKQAQYQVLHNVTSMAEGKIWRRKWSEWKQQIPMEGSYFKQDHSIGGIKGLERRSWDVYFSTYNHRKEAKTLSIEFLIVGTTYWV